MDIATEIYNDIIKEEGFFFRGVPLGASLDEVKELEGFDYEEVLGSLPHYEYFIETGEMEEIIIYYGFKEGEDTINSIDLFLYAYPKIYWEDSGGEIITDFFKLTQQGKLEEYSKHFDGAKNKIIQRLEDQLGKPEIVETDNVFNQPYHKFKKYMWRGDNKVFLSATEYIDDSKGDSVRNVLRLFLTKD
ncbi:hypothetical protein [Aquimarina sp. MMG016]|uniref:hypothetical protein n=1 Tax=Aquimarina sp. MMG016 TaxID=2822690 RepID=UPI001B3A2BB2|nr:hypothetical protein [Aquimarina sp. MMG016]MBQ4818572.1 hypothetical protein [Aquimarina sp. MMG016]